MLIRIAFFLVVLLATRFAVAQDQAAFEPLATEPQGGVIVADLEQQLLAGLKIRREQEQKFIAAVINLVEEKRLPVSLVKSIFHWSRRKNPKVPFPYFERGMRITAEKVGVQIVVDPAPQANGLNFSATLR